MIPGSGQESGTRVLFAGGGTGGHVYMAVAIRQELERRDPGSRCLFVGTDQGLETRILSPLAFPLRTIRVGGLNRVGGRRMVRTVLQLPASLIDSLAIVREFRPSAVVGLGGHSSGPVVVAAWLRRRPALLIEPNSHPGLTNRLLARFVEKAAVAFRETAPFFGSRAVVTGIPVRREFHEVRSRAVSDPARLLIFGGSQGSRPINRLVSDALAHLPKGLRITHQTGPDDVEWVRESYRRAGIEARVRDYLEDMPSALAGADLVISRAGASTVAELTAAGRASVLIPFPAAADDHQRKNARSLERKGAALLREQADLDGPALGRLLEQLLGDQKRLSTMASAARSLSNPDSVGRITDLIEELSQ